MFLDIIFRVEPKDKADPLKKIRFSLYYFNFSGPYVVCQLRLIPGKFRALHLVLFEQDQILRLLQCDQSKKGLTTAFMWNVPSRWNLQVRGGCAWAKGPGADRRGSTMGSR